MKAQKLFSLDYELACKLSKEKNASALVEALLKKHYESTDNPFLSMSEEQKAIERKKLEIVQEAERQLKEVDNGQGIPVTFNIG